MVRNQEAQARRMVDEDDQENWRSDLPRQFSALEDEHFPLFITFDKVSCRTSFTTHPTSQIVLQLCKLLEADILSDTQKELEDTVQLSPVDGFHRPNSLALSTNATLVSYYRFLQDYWEHFPQSLTKGLGE